jgi:predicted GNAT superfamily acetyltransferase
MNAHLNIAKLGCVAEEYHRNVYGESTSELHRGTPTDRLVAQWHITEAHVERRLHTPETARVTSADVAAAPTINRTAPVGAWRACESIDLALDAPRLWLEIPVGWTDLQRDEPEMAMVWRLQTREVFETYFARGYRVVDFAVRREDGIGRYLLADPTRVGTSPAS